MDVLTGAVAVNKMFTFRLCTTIILQCDPFHFLTVPLHAWRAFYIADPAIFFIFADVNKYFELYLYKWGIPLEHIQHFLDKVHTLECHHIMSAPRATNDLAGYSAL